MTQPQKGSLFSVIAAHLDPDSRTRETRRFNLEVGLGILTFFCLVSVVATLAAELRGRDALAQALVSLLFLSVTYLVYRAWKRAGGWGQ